MASFRNYDDHNRERGLFGLGALLGAGAALAHPTSRRFLVDRARKGLQGLSRRITENPGNIPPALRNTVAQFEHLQERGIAQAARSTLGHASARGVLETRLGAEVAEEITNLDRYGRFLFSGRITASEMLDTKGFRSLIERRGLDYGAAFTALEEARSAVPSLKDARELPGVIAAQDRAREMAARELERQAHAPRAENWIERHFGVRRARLGDLAGTAEGDALRARLAQFTDDADVLDRLPVGSMLQFGDETVDLRGLGRLATRQLDTLRDHVQIPLAPGAMGINPLQLFPWAQGRLKAAAAHIGSRAIDPQLRAHLGHAEQRLGTDVFKVGNEFFAADWIGESVTDLGIEGNLRSGIYGYLKRRSQDIEAAQTAGKAANPLEWLGIGRHAEAGMADVGPGTDVTGRLGSVLGKYDEESTWAPKLFERILKREYDELTPDDLRRAAGFLKTGKLGREQQEFLLAQGATLDDPLFADIGSVLDDENALFGFFESAAQRMQAMRATGDAPFASSELSELVGQWISNPGGLLNRHQPGFNRGLTGWNFAGDESPTRAAEMMRSAVVAEMEAKYALLHGDDAFIQLLQGNTGLTGKNRIEALAYAQGQQLSRIIESGQGLTPTWRNAADHLRRDHAAQEIAEQFTQQRVRFWHSHVESESLPLATAELFSQRSFSPKDALADFNRLRADGASYQEAFWEGAVKGRFGRQFGAFFTGNQKDVTDTTLFLEYFPRRLNQLLEEVGLGLPAGDLKSGGSILANLMAKRVAPAVLAVEGYRFADFQADQLGLPGPSAAYAELRSRAGFLRANLTGGEILGVRRELLPGLEQLVPDRTPEEEREHQEQGYEGVRKGRFWAIGSRTPFQGEKIDHWLPSAVRAAKSGWQHAENVGTSSAEYWSHSPIPNPYNAFLGPLGPGLWDPYWFENRFSTGPNAERPFLASGPRFDPHTAHGPLANLLLGWTKPRVMLHGEAVPRELGGRASHEDLRRLNIASKNRIDDRGVGLLVGDNAGGGGGGGWGGGGGGGRGGGSFVSTGRNPDDRRGEEPNLYSPGYLGMGGQFQGSIAEITPAGHVIPAALPGDLTAAEFAQIGNSSRQKSGWGTRLSRSEITRLNRLTKAGSQGMTRLRTHGLTSQGGAFSDADLDLIDFENAAVVGARNAFDLAGLYGFFAESGLDRAGLPITAKGVRIADASQAYGMSGRFYDQNLGGLGGPLSEFGRRFIPRGQKLPEWNPIRNRMPGWMPGSEHYLDLQHGDPYLKVPRGHLRLPGEAYEKLHPEVKLMQTRASSLGKSVDEIMRGMLFLQEPMSDYMEHVTELGTDIHAQLQRKWQRMGILVSAEKTIYNEKLGISGHYDALLNTEEGLSVVDIKTVSDKRFQLAKRQAFADHVSQLNFYMHELGVHQGSLLYINRDKPWEIHDAQQQYDPGNFQASVRKVQRARERLLEMVSKGTLNRGDLYDPVSRFEILADVAPYSENYAQVREYLVGQNQIGRLSEADNVRFQAAKKRSAQLKRRVDLFPDRFRGLHLQTRGVTVERILDANTLQIQGSDNPIRLAGVQASNARIEEVLGETPEGMTPAEHLWSRYGIQPGSRIRVDVEGDPFFRYADDTLRTQHAVVYGRGGNINQQLIESGIGLEKETDWSDTGVKARFTDSEIGLGKAWEYLAHLDTPIHSKFFKVRNAREELERGIVFGKRTGGWTDPIGDYLIPSLESYASKNPLIGGIATGVFARWFGKTKVAQQWLGVGGAILGSALGAARMLSELGSGEPWKPARTRKREELEEYWDTLKYVKYRGLAAHEEKLAKQKEGTDVQRMTRESYRQGRWRKYRKRDLEQLKRKLILGETEENQAETREKLAEVQEQINQLASRKEMVKLGPHATRALLYREQYRSTLYGIDPGETPFLNVIKAMPKYKRELVGEFVKASAKDRQRIYELLPRAERRVLGSYLGVDDRELPQRKSLGQFFADKPLPGPDWAGWSRGVDLEQLKMRALEEEGLDPMESGVFPAQIEEAERETRGIQVPTFRGTSQAVQSRLNAVLAGRGVRNARVRVDVQPHDGERDDLHVELRLRQRREQELKRTLQRGG